MSTTITHKTKAWITSHSDIGPQELAHAKVAEELNYTSHMGMVKQGWTVVGDAEITIMLVDQDTLVQNKVQALREELKTVRAEAQLKETKLESQIQNLLAISYEVPA